MQSLLNAIGFSLMETGYEVGLDWLGQFVRVIVEGVGIVGVGIIVFTLILKAITLPFDIYQRVKMRKQTLIMREMQPELEKLQKQYANDKQMYSQKMMELYKKNGYSMLGACLPMIISMIILIVAFQGFRAYSSYGNLKMYVEMSEAYNQSLAEYTVEGKDYRLPDGDEQGELIITAEKLEAGTWTEETVTYRIFTQNDVKYIEVSSTEEGKCIFYEYSLEGTPKKNYQIDKDKLLENEEAKKFVKNAVENGRDEDAACRDFLNHLGALGARAWYYDQDEQHDAHFLWVKNVWYPDVSYNHPIQPNYDEFIKQFDKVNFEDGRTDVSLSTVLDADRYNALISELVDDEGNLETEKPNGYFILIILSIGLMILSQFISMRSQKESNKYQTVDGSGARTQKIMLVMMPIIYAVFAFMYSAAFSIYMTMSSVVSILVTLLSNLIIGHVFKKKEAEAIKQRNTRVLPWMNQQSKTSKKDQNGRKK